MERNFEGGLVWNSEIQVQYQGICWKTSWHPSWQVWLNNTLFLSLKWKYLRFPQLKLIENGQCQRVGHWLVDQRGRRKGGGTLSRRQDGAHNINTSNYVPIPPPLRTHKRVVTYVVFEELIQWHKLPCQLGSLGDHEKAKSKPQSIPIFHTFFFFAKPNLSYLLLSSSGSLSESSNLDNIYLRRQIFIGFVFLLGRDSFPHRQSWKRDSSKWAGVGTYMFCLWN